MDHLSVYLDVADSAQLPYGWSRFAHFNLAVVNQYDTKMTVKKGTVFMLLSLKVFLLQPAFPLVNTSLLVRMIERIG